MQLTEHVPLSSLTTFRIGGAARYVAKCSTLEDIQTALTFARERGLPWYVIGGGSNILASDTGYEGVIIRPVLEELSFEDANENQNEYANKKSDTYIVTAGAAVVWDELVQESVVRGLWGLENLAGIPGFVGGAPVQNIGAYGADVSGTLTYVDALDTKTGEVSRFSKEECVFGYRDSKFKQDPSFIIIRAAFELSKNGTAHVSYTDLTAYANAGAVLDTPQAIADAVRTIRAKKFPDLHTTGTAGSFFKNPSITAEKYDELLRVYSELPSFPVSGTNTVKIPLAWILDHVLHLRGFTMSNVRCFEQQPLVIVAELGATSEEVENLASEVERQVKEVVGISIEREVRMLH